MDRITDEMLVAFLDGKLEPAERDAVAEALQHSDEARERLRLLDMTAADAPMWRVFDTALASPVPDRVVDAIMGAGTKAGVAPSAPPVVSLEHRRDRSKGMSGATRTLSSRPIGIPLIKYAAAIALGAALGWTATATLSAGDAGTRLVVSNARGLDAAGVLRAALERTPSVGTGSASGATSGTWSVAPVLSFRNQASEFCRQYRATGDGGQSLTGVACRAEGGNWRILAHVAGTHAKVATGSADGRTRPASGAPTSLVDGAIDALIAGDPLGGDEEKALIGRSWRP